MNSFNQLKISVRLAIGFGCMLVLMAVLAISTRVAVYNLSEAGLDVADNWMQSAILIQRIRANITEVRLYTFKVVDATNDSSRQHSLTKRNEAISRLRQRITDYGRYVDTDVERRDYPLMQQSAELWITQANKAMDMITAGQVDQARQALDGEVAEAAGKLEPVLNELIELNMSGSAKARQNVIDTVSNTRKQVWTVLGTAVALSIALALVISRSILGPIRQAITAANRIANRDLTQEITGGSDRNETGQMLLALQHMQAALCDTLQSMRGNAHELSDAARTLASASDQVAASSGHQSEATASVAASIEQLSASINVVKDAAMDSAATSKRSAELSTEGGSVIRATVDEMHAITDSVETTATNIRQLNEQAREISTVVNVISEVAEQTNLLALNASIEAARAGESGRGFAVVADEVRKLAERTKLATQDIATKIERIQAGATQSAESMEAAVTRANTGYQLAGKAGSAIDNILQEASSVHGSVASISAAVSEQSSTSLLIAANIERVAQMIEENSASASATAASASRLNNIVTDISDIVERFTLPSRG